MNLAQEFIKNPEVHLECQLGLYEGSVINAPIHPYIRGISAEAFAPGNRLLRFSINELFAYYYQLTDLGKAAGRVHHCTYIYPPHLVPKTPLVVTHYDCTVEKYQSHFQRAAMTVRLKRNIYQRADRIVSISNNSKLDLMDFYGIPEAKIEVAYPGVEVPLPREATVSPGGIDPRPYLLYVGARTFYKNFNGLLKAYANSKARAEFQLVAVGGGLLSQEESDLARKLGLEDKVTCIPYAQQPELAWLYYHAHGMIYPSMYEGFGFPPLEAMSMSCPVLVSNSSCLPEVLADGPLYFESGSGDDLCEKLDLLCYNGELRNSLINRGLNVVNQYTWTKSADELLSVYKHTLA
jgi:glycosyltransferase involved in cell wall biosynthesis